MNNGLSVVTLTPTARTADPVVGRAAAALRGVGCIVDDVTDPGDRSRWAAPERFVDVAITADPIALLTCRGAIAAANPGCAFVLIAVEPPTDAASRRAVREADLVVVAAVAERDVAAIPLRAGIANVPAVQTGWIDVVERALDARHAANSLVRRQAYPGRLLTSASDEPNETRNDGPAL